MPSATLRAVRPTAPLLVFSLLALLAGCGGETTATTATTSGGESTAIDPAALDEFEAGVRELGRGGRAAERRARAHFEAALEIDPGLWEARYDLGVLDRQAGDLLGASQAFEAARALAPSSGEVLTALAEVRWALGERDAAASILRSYVASHADDASARVSLATMLRGLGDHDGALAQAREVLVRDPRNVAALAEVGRAYAAREQWDIAELVFRKALDLGESATIHNDLGLLELARGDTQAAFEHFRAAIALDASFAPAHLNQGAVLLRAGDYAGAEAEYRAVLAHDAGNADARVCLGTALRGRGELRDARREYANVLEAMPSHAAALYNMGVLLAEFLDERAEARSFFQRYLAAAPGSAPERATAERYVRDIDAELGPAAAPPAAE